MIEGPITLVTYLEIGDRILGDQVTYPDANLSAKFTEQGWMFSQK